ncbi:MAG: ABC-type branched-chain amino acid transport system periplasmic component-like protein [Nocardioides sp.]|nr:ABC-type branched-chain amino acid transport system periplasmic component-like protein [Nocardioides sp.]
MRHQRIARWGVVAAGLLLIASACSSNRAGDDPTGTAGTAGGTTAPADTGLPTDTFGDLATPCGAGDASGATEQGVTDASIAIGYGDDKGFTGSPGLNEELGDAMDAMIEWCNSLGGINGRKIVGHRYDAALLNSAQVIKEACAQDFMLVGEGFAGDENMEADRIACKLVSVPGFQLSPNAAMGPMQYMGLPFPVDRFNPATLELALQTYPEFAQGYDWISHDSPFVQLAQGKLTSAIASLGGKAGDCGVEIKSAGGDNYRALVQKYKECGVTALWDNATPTPPGYALLDAMKVEGFKPTIMTETTWYLDQVTEANSDGLTEGINVTMQFQPFENADLVPAVADYLSVVNATGGKIGTLGMQATSSFLLWATAAKECGADLTRQCMVDHLSKVTEWTGGGLHAPSSPGGNLPPSCGLIMKVEGDHYVQVAPEERGKFYCADGGPAETDPATWGIEINADRVATTYLTDDIITPSA